MGSIYRRGSRYWIRYRDQKTRRLVRKSAGQTYQEAQDLLKREAGISSPGVALAPLIADYLKRCEVRTKHSTLIQYRSAGKRLELALGHINALRLQPKDLDRYVTQRRADGVSDNTVNLDLRILRAILRYAVNETRKLPSLPLQVKSLRASNRRNPPLLTPAESERLLDHAKRNPRIYGILLVSLSTGFRMGEILHLAWADIDWNESALHVSNKPDWTTKTYQERISYVPLEILDFLLDYRERSKFNGENHYIFATQTGTAMNVNNACRLVRRVFNKAGVYVPGKGLTHRIRHTAASRMVANGVDLRTVQSLLGHASINTTSLYLHAMDEKKREAASKIGLVGNSVLRFAVNLQIDPSEITAEANAHPISTNSARFNRDPRDQ